MASANKKAPRARARPAPSAAVPPTALAEEMAAMRAEIALLRARPPPAAAKTPTARTIAASHQPQKNSLSSVLSAGAKRAMKFLKEQGMETLFTLGTALLSSDRIKCQPGVTDTVLPAGTVLGWVDLYPNFADQLAPGTHTRLSRVASTFMRWRFAGKTCVNFVPAAGALTNGQIGMFITTDPRYDLVATGQAAVRLVHEFNGAVCQISQGMCLNVPPKLGDWLYVEDAHESDVRFTRQGTLWVIAFTDIDITSAGSSLGEFRLDYECELKDNSIDGVAILPASLPDLAYYVGPSSSVGLAGAGSATSVNFGLFGTSVSGSVQGLFYGVNGYCITSAAQQYLNDPIADYTFNQNSAGLAFMFGTPGLYHIKAQADFYYSLNVSGATITSGDTAAAHLQWFDYNLTTSATNDLQSQALVTERFHNLGSGYTVFGSTPLMLDYYLNTATPGENHTIGGLLTLTYGTISTSVSPVISVLSQSSLTITLVAPASSNPAVSLDRGFLTARRQNGPGDTCSSMSRLALKPQTKIVETETGETPVVPPRPPIAN
jgi:hypothetical protein